MTNSIPLNDLARHHAGLSEQLDAATRRVVHSGWYVLGNELTAFEAEFAAWCGVNHAIGVGNGTDALELALRALGCGPGDEVLTVANAGMYSATAILCTGARPVFVDIDPLTLTMDPDSLARAKGPRAKVVIVTHLYGRLADMARLRDAAGGLPMVEDCAQAHGAQRDGVRAGAFGDVACFSFFPTKNLGGVGDGGGVVTNDSGLAEDVRRLRQYGWTEKYFAGRAGGRNSRLDEIQAAVLRVKLPLLDGWNARRRAIALRYAQALPGGAMPMPGLDDVAHLAVARLKDRDGVRSRLAALGINTAIHYPVADYDQPALAGLGEWVRLSMTDAALGEIVTLPCFPELTDEEVSRVVAALGTVI